MIHLRRAAGMLALTIALVGCTGTARPEVPVVSRSSTTRAVPAPTGDPDAAGKGAALGVRLECPSGGITVHTAAELTSALAAVVPGSVIRLADGIYPGQFTAETSGTARQPIWLCGGDGALLDAGDIDTHYGFHLQNAEYWRLLGFSVRGGQKGVVADASSDCVIQGLTVTDVGDEAIHLRSATSDCVVRGNTIARTGRLNAIFGEGIYVGSARNNWSKYGTDGGPDRSDHDLVVGNTISATTAESVDIKEGTTGGALLDNTFDGTGGLTAADSWVDVKGNQWLIQGNHGISSPTDGFQVHTILPGWGQGNVFRDNAGAVDGTGYGIHLAGAPNNLIYCDNLFTGAPLGDSNVVCR